MADRDATEQRRQGPRGGVTTRSRSGMVKKNQWLTGAMAEALRQRAERDGVSEAEVVRRCLARCLREPE